MKRMFVVCALVGTMLVPAALAADPVPADFKNAAKYCQALRTAKGVDQQCLGEGRQGRRQNGR